MLLGDWEDAISFNKMLIKENSKDIDALNRLAYVLAILGKISEAKTIYKKVLKIDVLNQIATRNIKKFTDLSSKQIAKNTLRTKGFNNMFLEETGKTKIVSLVNVAQPEIIALLNTGQPAIIIIKRSRIFVQNHNGQYLGVLPDDIGKRLIGLIKGGNAYTAHIKCAEQHNVSVFIRETKRTSRYKNLPSFSQSDSREFSLSKQKTKMKSYKFLEEDEASSSFSAEES